MPIYEYRCKKNHSFDVLQRFSDDPIDVCEVCGAPASRVFRAPAVHFKGSGFYNTDYGTRKRSREKEATAKESSSSSSESESKTSGDSKSSGDSSKSSSGDSSQKTKTSSKEG